MKWSSSRHSEQSSVRTLSAGRRRREVPLGRFAVFGARASGRQAQVQRWLASRKASAPATATSSRATCVGLGIQSYPRSGSAVKPVLQVDRQASDVGVGQGRGRTESEGTPVSRQNERKEKAEQLPEFPLIAPLRKGGEWAQGKGVGDRALAKG